MRTFGHNFLLMTNKRSLKETLWVWRFFYGLTLPLVSWETHLTECTHKGSKWDKCLCWFTRRVLKETVTWEMFLYAASAAAKSLQSCPTLCDPIDRSPPGSPIPGILQARTLEWVAISFSNAGKWKVKVNSSRPYGLQPTRLLHPWDFPGKSTGVGYHCLLRCFSMVIL